MTLGTFAGAVVDARNFSIPDSAPTVIDGSMLEDLDLPEGAAIRIMPDGTNQTIDAQGQPLGVAPDLLPIGPVGTTVRFFLSLLYLSEQLHGSSAHASRDMHLGYISVIFHRPVFFQTKSVF
jgi:hypothetical protein